MTECTLHIYDVTNSESENTNYAISQINAFGRYLSLGGVFHGGIEVYGIEWSFGMCERGSGVYNCNPRDNPMYTYRESISLGTTTLSRNEVDKLVQSLKQRWTGKGYEMLTNNCNHFCQEFAKQLGVADIPVWLNRLADGAKAAATFSTQTSEQVHSMSVNAQKWWQSWVAPVPEAAAEKDKPQASA